MSLNTKDLTVLNAHTKYKGNTKIYARLPRGMQRLAGWDENGRPRLMRILRPQYGMKDAGRAWQTTLNSFLVGDGFVRSSADPCVYCPGPERPSPSPALPGLNQTIYAPSAPASSHGGLSAESNHRRSRPAAP